MKRYEIIDTIGIKYLKSNIENDEYSYQKGYKEKSIKFIPIKNRKGNTYRDLDLRFVKDNISVLVETKQNFEDDIKGAEEQLSAYIQYEKNLTGNKVIGILVNTNNDKIKVYRGIVSEETYLEKDDKLKKMEEYVDLYTSKINNKEEVMKNTYELNELLHKYGISEKLRAQFVGTCLLALKNELDYKSPKLKQSQITGGIKGILSELLNDNIDKATKLVLLNKNILESQDIKELKIEYFRDILNNIEGKILPFINDKNTAGQDLLNLFFITFNKYVGKADKNQAFTPDHITDFMTKITGVNKNSIILDPCCGSGSFLVRGMTQALDNCSTKEEQEKVKSNQILGIEFDENVYGLATTNMLIHSDGNSNLKQGSCFDFKEWIQEKRPNIILMNPPYNAQRKHMPISYTETWKDKKKEDPSKGLYFAKFILNTMNEIKQTGKLAILLPVACAIGTSKEISEMKSEILKENTLEAVFTLPNEVFYPGASASACCMVFKIGTPHSSLNNPKTFFGYYKDDGFIKKKKLGRVEQVDNNGKSLWVEIEKKWIDLYVNRKEVDGLSAVHEVDGKDEWLCEAYMKTDYSTLTDKDFEKTIRNYYSYLIKNGGIKNE